MCETNSSLIHFYISFVSERVSRIKKREFPDNIQNKNSEQ